MIKYINLEDLFKNNCPHEGCIHNEDNMCVNYRHISEFMTYRNGDNHAKCHIESMKDGYCPECMAKMTLHTESLPYGSETAKLRHYECDKC